MASKTYSGEPGTSARDAVRFLARDNIDGQMRLTDEEIDWILTQEPGGVYLAAAMACDMLVDRGLSSKSVGDLSLDFDIDSYQDLAKQLRARGITLAYPIATSVPESDLEHDPYFRLGMHDYE